MAPGGSHWSMRLSIQPVSNLRPGPGGCKEKAYHPYSQAPVICLGREDKPHVKHEDKIRESDQLSDS